MVSLDATTVIRLAPLMNQLVLYPSITLCLLTSVFTSSYISLILDLLLTLPSLFPHTAILETLPSTPISDHKENLHEVPDEYLAYPIVVAKKADSAFGPETYNYLQLCSDLF
jgi:hypothetical protein